MSPEEKEAIEMNAVGHVFRERHGGNQGTALTKFLLDGEGNVDQVLVELLAATRALQRMGELVRTIHEQRKECKDISFAIEAEERGYVLAPA